MQKNVMLFLIKKRLLGFKCIIIVDLFSLPSLPMTPRPYKFPSPLGEGFLPCKRPSAERGVRPWGRGGSVFFPFTVFLYPSVSFINITAPTPIPLHRARGDFKGRANIACVSFGTL